MGRDEASNERKDRTKAKEERSREDKGGEWYSLLC